LCGGVRRFFIHAPHACYGGRYKQASAAARCSNRPVKSGASPQPSLPSSTLLQPSLKTILMHSRMMLRAERSPIMQRLPVCYRHSGLLRVQVLMWHRIVHRGTKRCSVLCKCLVECWNGLFEPTSLMLLLLRAAALPAAPLDGPKPIYMNEKAYLTN